MHEIIRRFILAIVGFAVGALVCVVEMGICETAYGGPFTIMVSFILKFAFTGLAVSVSLLGGLILFLPGIRALWRRIGFWSLVLSVAAMCIMIFASKLGIRKVDPVSNYRMMPFGLWILCLVGIVFPIVNLPSNREK